ncbi:MAG: universal stress protein [Cyanobacteria bacterium P01_A01_bin.135]
MFNTVLFPLDQTRESRHAAELVVSLVKAYSSKLTLLSVVEAAEESEAMEEPGGTSSAMASPEAIAELLESARSLFQQAGIEAAVEERQGMPAFVICDVADEINADLIVMGSRGIGLTEEGLSDSVSNRVINLSPCPVLIVP